MRILFLGNHDVGIEALKAIRDCSHLVGVVAHPEDPEDGIAYKSVYNYANEEGLDVIRSNAKSSILEHFVDSRNPDLLWVTDYRYIIPKTLINKAVLGGVNLHPSLLPKYRGRAPLNWAIINGETKTGLTAHFLDEGIDTGDIIKQIEVPISECDDIANVLDKLYPVYYKITSDVLQDFENNRITAYPQTDYNDRIYPGRTPKQGKVDWNASVIDIYNLVRAVAKPYPGAFAYSNEKKIFFWKAHYVLKNEIDTYQNGEVIKYYDHLIHIKCRDGILVVEIFETETEKIKVGDIFS